MTDNDFHMSVPNLKERIIAVLAARNLTYKQLTDYLGVSEQQLDHALEQNTIEIRTLEQISKDLRIPLYRAWNSSSRNRADNHIGS